MIVHDLDIVRENSLWNLIVVMRQIHQLLRRSALEQGVKRGMLYDYWFYNVSCQLQMVPVLQTRCWNDVQVDQSDPEDNLFQIQYDLRQKMIDFVGLVGLDRRVAVVEE